MAFDTGALVKQIVAADSFGIGVGEEGIGVTSLAAEILGFAGRVDADGYGPDA